MVGTALNIFKVYLFNLYKILKFFVFFREAFVPHLMTYFVIL